MYITVDQSTFIREFEAYGRADQFSYEALSALFDYYDESEDYELDVIAICCDWTEYEDMQEAIEAFWDYEAELNERLPEECQADYRDEYDEEDEDMDPPREATDDEMEEAKDTLQDDFLEYLNNHTACITLSEGILVQQF